VLYSYHKQSPRQWRRKSWRRRRRKITNNNKVDRVDGFCLLPCRVCTRARQDDRYTGL
jgi:hypothetical protein